MREMWAYLGTHLQHEGMGIKHSFCLLLHSLSPFICSLSLSLSLSNSLSSYIILRFLSCFDYNFSLTFCLHFWSRFQMLPLHFLFVLLPS